MSPRGDSPFFGPSLRDQCVRAAEAAFPLEACGVLLGRGVAGRSEVRRPSPPRPERTRPRGIRLHLAVSLPNLAADPFRAFLIDPLALMRVEKEARREGLEILGIFHSHPEGGGPSSSDLALPFSFPLHLLLRGPRPWTFCRVRPPRSGSLRPVR